MQRMDLSKKKTFGGQQIAAPDKFAVKLMATVHKYTNERTGNIDLHIQVPESAGTSFEREIREALATDRLEEEIKGPYKNGELRVRVKRPEVYHILIDCLKETTLGYKLEVLEPQKDLPAWKRPEIVLDWKTDAGTLFNEHILLISVGSLTSVGCEPFPSRTSRLGASLFQGVRLRSRLTATEW